MKARCAAVADGADGGTRGDAGRRVYTRMTDVADPEQCQALVDSAVEAFGRVDVLINNAGVRHRGAGDPGDPEQFRAVVDVNLHGSYWMAQACARVMQPGSAIVNVSSILGLTTGGLPQAAYSASKAGVLGLTRDLAQQWGPAGNSGQRAGAGLLQERDDRRVQAGISRQPAAANRTRPHR